MVKIIGYNKPKEGRKHNRLILQGDLEFIPSKTPGLLHAIPAICTVACHFTEVICAGLVGKTMPGAIEKMECLTYEYEVPNTGEIVVLDFTWYYSTHPRTTMEQEVFSHAFAA